MPAPFVTTLKDTLYLADGSLFTGTLVVINDPFTSADGRTIPGRQISVVPSNGVVRTHLVPTSGTDPSDITYTARYYQTTTRYYQETWTVPVSSPLSNPGAPAVTQSGTPGAVTYYYWISALNATGETILGPSGLTTTSAATLNGTDYNVIEWQAVDGAVSYNVWRTSTATAPSGTGLHLVGNTASTTINDQSNNLSSATVPVVNDTDFVRISDLKGNRTKAVADTMDNMADDVATSVT